MKEKSAELEEKVTAIKKIPEVIRKAQNGWLY